MGVVDVVVGGQFGSEGKGAVAAHLGKTTPGPIIAARVAGPNAGHSAVDWRGERKWALRQIPVVAVTRPNAVLVLGAGSEVDEAVLKGEIVDLEEAGIPVAERLMIDHSATMITPEMKAEEMGGSEIHGELGLTQRIGSTGKGVGAARAARVMRTAELWSDKDRSIDFPFDLMAADTASVLPEYLKAGYHVLLEGTQGYGLGLHTEFYPQCTSSDCRAIDFLSMAGISPWAPWVDDLRVWVCLRTYPIRVAGNSGPLYHETDWETLAEGSGGYIQPEFTTVTQKLRRVGAWDAALARRAVQENGGEQVRIALTFFDYWYPELGGLNHPGVLGEDQWNVIRGISQEAGAEAALLGTGPDSIIDIQARRS